MSPELLECDDAEGGTPTIASDVYAVAMVFYEVGCPNILLGYHVNAQYI